MVGNEKIGWKQSVRFIVKNEKVLVANVDNGQSLFISKECFDIIMQAIEEGITFGELIDSIEDMDSKLYMKHLLEMLDKIRMWDYESGKIKSNMFELSIDITNLCNLRCKHCCISAGDNIRGEELSESKMANMVEEIAKLNPKTLTLSGGEPLMRKDFRGLVSIIRKNYHGILTLMTNATLINHDIAEFICSKFNAVDISIDGYDEESCAILRGEGTFDKCIQGIKLLKVYGMKHISASMVLTKENVKGKKNFFDLCERLGVKPLLRILDNSGRAKNIYKESVSVTNQENDWEAVKENFTKNKWKLNLPQVFACQGAKTSFQFDHKGNIYPCGILMQDDFYLGNIFEVENLKEYLEEGKFQEKPGYKYFESLKPYNLTKCKDCDFNILCFSCVNEIKKLKEQNELEGVCLTNKQYFELYWRDNEID